MRKLLKCSVSTKISQKGNRLIGHSLNAAIAAMNGGSRTCLLLAGTLKYVPSAATIPASLRKWRNFLSAR